MRPIIVNGVRRQATISLESTLGRLREIVELGIMIWIDALCTNQTDDVERSQRVGIMGDIYRLTQEAMIWIGKEEVDCDFTDYYITKMQSISSRPDRLGQVGLEELDVFLEENRVPFPSTFPMPVPGLERTAYLEHMRYFICWQMIVIYMNCPFTK